MSDTDPMAPTTALNKDGKTFREGKGTVHWIRDRNIVVYLSLLVKGGLRISSDDTFPQMTIKPVLLLLPALDFYSQEIESIVQDSSGIALSPSYMEPRDMAELQLLSAHSPCFLQGNYLLPLKKSREDQQHIHEDQKALASQATLCSLLYLLSS